MSLNMNSSKINVEELLETISSREKDEIVASGIITTEILKRLEISIEKLPQRCQTLLHDTVTKQSQIDLGTLDNAAKSLIHSKNLLEKIEEEYEILKLEQKNKELQAKIDRNNKFIKDLREELVASKESLMRQNPNPETIKDQIKQCKARVASYEETYEKWKADIVKSIPDVILPSSLKSQISALVALQQEEEALRQAAEDVELTKAARDTFVKFNRMKTL